MWREVHEEERETHEEDMDGEYEFHGSEDSERENSEVPSGESATEGLLEI
jgi:hypothetical protein